MPSAPATVPRLFHTDGTWVWPAAVGYYLYRHGLPPQPELLAHIRTHNYAPPPVAQHTVEAAGKQLIAMLDQQYQAAAGADAAAATGPAQSGPLEPRAVRLGEFGAAFNAAGNRHAAWVTEQVETFIDFLPLGDWSVDHASRRYFQSGREFLVDALGALSADGVWTWAWADPRRWGGPGTAITEQSRRLRAFGERYGIVELVAGSFDLTDVADAPDDPTDAAEMIAWTAMGLLGARGYMGHTASPDGLDGRVYYVVCDAAVPQARPGLGTIPRYLMEGAATFGEDAAECVLGYIEHYGWEWSRVPDGIVVAAEGIGSFTVEVSAEGYLTGLSLHT